MTMSPASRTLTLDAQVTYEIKVSGLLDGDWSDWVGGTTRITGTNDAGSPVGIITGTFDQAALHGFLRRLYSLGFPLISVNRV